MFRAAIVTPCQGDGLSSETAYESVLATEYPLLREYDHQLVESRPCVPNEYTVLIECDEDVLAAIDNDPDYEVMWSEEVTDAT